MSFLKQLKNLGRDVGSLVTGGAIDSSAHVARRRASKQARAQIKAARRTAATKYAKGAKKDIARIEGKADKYYAASMAAIKDAESDSEGQDRLHDAQIAKLNAAEGRSRSEINEIARGFDALNQQLVPADKLAKINSDGIVSPAEAAMISFESDKKILSLVGANAEAAAEQAHAIDEIFEDLVEFEVVAGRSEANTASIGAMAAELVANGLTSSGDKMKDAARGLFTYRGHRFDLRSAMMSMLMMKTSRLHLRRGSDAKFEFSDLLSDEKDECKFITGMCVPSEEAKAPANFLTAFTVNPVTGNFREVSPSAENGLLPAGCLVYTGGNVAMTPDFRSYVKLIVGGAATTLDKYYGIAAPLFSGSIENLLNLSGGSAVDRPTKEVGGKSYGADATPFDEDPDEPIVVV